MDVNLWEKPILAYYMVTERPDYEMLLSMKCPLSNEMSIYEMIIYKMYIYKMCIYEMSIYEMSIHEMSIYEISHP